jgi:cell division protease FtsH
MIARQMVLTWGMSSELGLISYGPDMGAKEPVYMVPAEKEYSEKTAETIDGEVKKLTDEAFGKAKKIINANKDKLESIAKALLKYETLDADDVKVILEGKDLDKPTVGDLLAAEQAKEEQEKTQTEGPQEKPAE